MTVTQDAHDDLVEFAHAEQHRANEAEAEVKKLREALAAIADGRWNVGATRDLNVREFARKALYA